LPNPKNGGSPTPLVFDHISSYWAEIADANRTQQQLDFVKNHISSNGLVLDLNCGNGRHAVPLNKAGYDVAGLDISPRLLRIAKKRASEEGITVSLVRADMRFLPFRTDVFSGVISLDSSFGYLPSEDEDKKSLNELSRTLAESGVFLLDVFNREDLRQRYGRLRFRDLFWGLAKNPQLGKLFRWREYPSFYMLQKRKITRNGEKLQDSWIFMDKNAGKISLANHVIRLYQFSQLQMLINRSGLKVAQTFGGYEGQRFSGDAKRLIIIAAKN
jgi:SAM-dependent methyltransferase